MKKIVVVGSTNTDMVIYSNTIPRPGETVMGGEFLMNPGGKGANQAVAAAKIGTDITFLTSIGDDIFGTESLENFKRVGIDTSHIKIVKNCATGTALILVDANGENCISVASGANVHLLPSDIQNASAIFDKVELALFQLESPIETVHAGLKAAKKKGCTTVLNPAPAQYLPDELLALVDIITPNETEVELLTDVTVTNIDSAFKAAKILRAKGIETVVITMGKEGAYVLNNRLNQIVPAPSANAIDTTAAGDTFNGAFVVGLSENKTIEEAIDFANRAAALSVTRKGAQSSIPNREEL